ncbi:hypothetical protein RW1_060_00320 [Rhodococcus wratislaviensis NBRC 100605]|uniref:PI3K/PI4K catalytic domain-containing protein n=1 Tax=Rhodococcus wratislaviensis NBRC 100605 TaxID=1219028 RepID=X0PZ37_RHOWR|nr:hypothetical protein RW1_060_00320 [Rhodococcus wratislaviensis NBRC 100605]
MGTRESWWGVARVHVKAQEPDAKYMLANELICCRLAAAMGLPVLPGEIAMHPNGRNCWITPQIQLGGMSLPPVDESRVVADQPIVSAGMYAFDWWVRNEDRHVDNVLFDPRLGIWLIDHEDCLGGATGDRMDALLRTINAPLGWHMFRDQPLDPTHVGVWVARIKALPLPAIDGPLQEAYERNLLSRSDQIKLKAFLVDRRAILDSLLRNTADIGQQIEIMAEELGGA